VFNRGLGVPSELWPMPSQFVRVVPGAAGDADFVKGYRYGIEPDAVPFAADEVIPFRLPNPPTCTTAWARWRRRGRT
jgi:hypothetical protein